MGANHRRIVDGVPAAPAVILNYVVISLLGLGSSQPMFAILSFSAHGCRRHPSLKFAPVPDSRQKPADLLNFPRLADAQPMECN